MKLLLKVAKRKIVNLYRREVLKDPFLNEAKRWFRDQGDVTRRLDYDLNAASVVLDLGGYLGDFAADISKKFGSSVYLFEPVPDYYEKCVQRFRDNPKIHCHRFGIGSTAQHMPMSISANESSFLNTAIVGSTIIAEIRTVTSVLQDLGIENIDLFKINIEGGEYDVLPACISSGIVSRVRNFQIQFHNFIPGADNKRNKIRADLSKTHNLTWCYDFIWENWELKK